MNDSRLLDGETGPSDDALLAAAPNELAEAAVARRDGLFGKRVTFSPKVFLPLTMLCRDRCGYCTFAKPPARLEDPYMSAEAILAIARAGVELGCHEALFTLGERPELRYRVAKTWLEERGYATTLDYLAAMARLVRDETGLLPHLNAGALNEEELSALRPVSVSQGMMLESLDEDLACHRAAPDKTPARRLATLEAAGRLQIPFTTGVLVGIGDDRVARLDALRAIAASHARHGHVQEVLVQGFLPKEGTAMHDAEPCSLEELSWTIAAARLIMAPEVHIQSPPNLVEEVADLLEAGVDDLGGVSPVTIDHVNPERAWPELASLEASVEAAGHVLAPRLAIHPRWALEPTRFLDEAMRFPVLDRSDAEGLGRDSAWVAGGHVSPPLLVESPRPASTLRDTGGSGRIVEILEGARFGQELGEDEIEALFTARGSEVDLVTEVADDLRREIAGDTVTFVANRNINYTNVCTFKCRFCAFSKGPLSLNLRGAPYLLELDELTQRVVEAEEAGATEVCLQGGIHPSFDGDYYLEVIKAVRAGSERIHIHGFTALEVTEGARRLEEPLATYLQRLYDAGLRTIPGTAAEILDDEVRAVLCPDKINTEQWLEAHRTAHGVGLRSNVTIMFGSIEQPRNWARHIVRTRALQKETGGFTEFVPLPFVHMATPIYLQRRARRGPTFREVLLMHAVGRIAYAATIPNVQASWVKTGTEGLRQLLFAGCNDTGGTLMDENISRAAGAEHGQMMTPEAFREVIEPLGRPVEQRTTLYGRPGVRVSGPAGVGDGAALGDHAPPSEKEALLVRELLEASNVNVNADLIRRLVMSSLRLSHDEANRLDLKIVGSAIEEMGDAFKMFAPYNNAPKVTIFGSARTAPTDRLYELTRELARRLAVEGWMVVTGAGPGIMAAGNEGAGPEMAIGVNIRLPFETEPNRWIAHDTKLVDMKYFFTRKLMLMKESAGFVCLPGGFGTLDEAFELLTLVQTGKAEPAPIVLVDVPGGSYWSSWERFVVEQVYARNLADAHDAHLYCITDDAEAAIEEILGFHRNYHSRRFVGNVMVMRLRYAPSDEELASLNTTFGDLCSKKGIWRTEALAPERSSRDNLDLHRIALEFDRVSNGRLRQLIDALNAFAPTLPTRAAPAVETGTFTGGDDDTPPSTPDK